MEFLKPKNPAVRGIMSWVDAIVFALVAVYFVNIYIFQNYQIPSSSLEKSLLVGDFLYVSKMSYGPRVPNTPLSMPLAQHTLPIFNTKSYIEWPQWKYKRVPGFGKVKLNDIVVFNFPAGDTVALNRQQEDFYNLAYREGQRVYPNKINMDSLTRDQQRTVYDLYYNAGRNLIRTNPQMYGDIVVRPVDRRENYVNAASACREIPCKSKIHKCTSMEKPSRIRRRCSSTISYRPPARTYRKRCFANWASVTTTRY